MAFECEEEVLLRVRLRLVVPSSAAGHTMGRRGRGGEGQWAMGEEFNVERVGVHSSCTRQRGGAVSALLQLRSCAVIVSHIHPGGHTHAHTYLGSPVRGQKVKSLKRNTFSDAIQSSFILHVNARRVRSHGEEK